VTLGGRPTPNFFYSDLRRLGLPPKDITDLATLVIDAAKKSSYAIFINQEYKYFYPEGQRNEKKTKRKRRLSLSTYVSPE